MRGYAIIRKNGEFVEGSLPEGIDVEKFSIMCAAAFGAAHASHLEFGKGAEKVIVRGEGESILISHHDEKHLLVVIGSEEVPKELGLK
jgi:predicted regulator of Ras-like GTPase activity (Roadblock/LC7/MglB family)